jgi:hypothetical protein
MKKVTLVMAMTRRRLGSDGGRSEALVAWSRFAVVAVVGLLVAGCTSVGHMPQGTNTTVDLSRKNYRVVKANAVGESTGFSLFGVIPFVSPRHTKAMTDLYAKAQVKEGTAFALTNVLQEESNIYLILFSLPKLSISADVVEFTDEAGGGRSSSE